MADAKKTLRITQVKSSIGYKEDQGKTKVKHLVKVEEI